MDFLFWKWVHITSAAVLFGTGIGIAFCMLLANRRKDISGIYFATRFVVVADTVFTAPAALVQLATGIYLSHLMGYPLLRGWVFAALLLFAFVGACWLPVVWLQIKMLRFAKAAHENSHDLPDIYRRYYRWWLFLGSLAFPAMLVLFYLMIFKPAFF